MTEIKLSHLPDSDWNKRLENSPLGTIYQTKEYAKYLELRSQIKPIFLQFINENGLIVGQNLFFQSFKGKAKLESFFGKGIFSNTVSLVSKLLPKKIIWSYGPLIFDKNYENDIINSLGKWLTSIKGTFRGTSHPLYQEFNFPSQFNFRKEKISTFIIDLKNGLDTIFKNTDKKSVQKNIKRAEERGVKITLMQSEKDYSIYYELQKKYRAENQLQPYLRDDIFDGFKLLEKIGWKGFLAWFDDKPIGAISFSHFNGYIHESGIARSKTDSENNLYSQDLLRWKIIEWGLKNNCRFYDLAGVKTENQSTKEAGIFRNKKKWGGTLYDYWVYRK
jgi:hypothetical protein